METGKIEIKKRDRRDRQTKTENRQRETDRQTETEKRQKRWRQEK